ncbi:hypothetical protein SAMN05518845_11060 [Variovorax sp. YR750]|uniref:hypothetical protein n=1 Tax=Variovorax sp. YR750 TaxID=1884384 RepID=UPI0008CDDDA5|nr:hypothetical protein [Variovorax sp. YR750]SEL70141.1 hypothetical protein SAMN05518845_11060 [Variovorax sp. YR750]
MHALSDASLFTQVRFWGLVLCSLVIPGAIFITLFVRREFSKRTVLAFGLLLIVLAGMDIFLLRALSLEAQATPSLADDIVFSSELSIALYIFPAAFGTFGLNMVSHVLMHYLKQKEARFEAHRNSAQPALVVEAVQRGRARVPAWRRTRPAKFRGRRERAHVAATRRDTRAFEREPS